MMSRIGTPINAEHTEHTENFSLKTAYRTAAAAELTTGPRFNQIASAPITMMAATKIRTLTANLRAAILGLLSATSASSSILMWIR